MSFRSRADEAELDQAKLFELGATGIEELEETQASEGGSPAIKAFFEAPESFRDAAEAFCGREGFQSGEAPVEDWDRSWRDRQTPVEVTPSLVVAPPWVDPGTARFAIRLEAKMAFGTGSHESTRIAALLLEKLDLRGRSVLDIGTGTGILALYAGLLGARDILALDIDPVTGPCLRENLALNPMPPGCRFRPFVGELASLSADARFDVIVCNMIRTELWPFREELRDRLRPGGHFVVSGQRLEDKPWFESWRAGSPFRMALELEMDGWWGFAATPAGLL
jgi:ribosomal protein L11 methyltransferase